MPLYTFRNKETGEVKDMMLSIADMQTLKSEGEWEQLIGAPSLVSHTGNIINKTSSDWKDHLKNIKKSTSRRYKNSINI